MQPESETQVRPTAAGHPHPGLAASPAEYMAPAGQTMAQVAYPYIDPYYGGIFGAYGGQPVVNASLMAMPPNSLPLATDSVLEPVYVNAKQYHGILRRRQSRAKAESENKMIKSRKSYLHESRHLHALKRARGSGGRFLNTKTGDGKEDQKSVDEKENEATAAPDKNKNDTNTTPAPENLTLSMQLGVEASDVAKR